jgi:soluble lytic murein transglycosylase-like protein
VKIGPRGYEATRQRMQEIQARIRTLRPQDTPVFASEAASLSGSIGKGGSFTPVDPFRDGATAVPSGPPQDLRPLIHSSAQQAGIDPVLLESLVAAESDFNPRTVSNKGAMGLTQLMPGTARALGVGDPLDPAQNLAGGAKYLAQMLKSFGGDERLALAAYNAGPGAVKKFGGVPPFKETQDYVARVMARVQSLRGRP